MPDPHVTIIYSNHSRCAYENEVGACDGFWVIAYWEINVELIDGAIYGSSQSNSSLAASIDASTREIESARSFDHTPILTTMLVATTVYLAMRKPICFVSRRPRARLTLGELAHEGKLILLQ